MSTSRYAYRVKYKTTTTGGPAYATAPVDAVSSVFVLNDLNHLADEYAQVRVAWSTRSAKGIPTGTPALVTTPYLITQFAFPISVRQSGAGYKLRVRIGGAAGTGGITTIFYAVLSNTSGAAATIATASDAVFTCASTTSITGAWLTGTSGGTGAYTTMMEMSQEQVDGCWIDRPTYEEDGGNSASVRVPWVTLSIFASTGDVTALPVLMGVYAAEVIGL